MQLAFYMQVHLMDFNESNDLKKVEDINTTFCHLGFCMN